MTSRLLAQLLLFCLAPSTAMSQAVGDVYEQVHQSVVVIRTEQRAVAQSTQGQLTAVAGIGSGVLISADGKVLTAAHVVQAADEVVVDFPSGERIPAQVRGSEPSADVALLQLERVPREFTVAKVGDSDGVRVGDQVFVVGAPHGITHTLTVGHISARRQPSRMISGLELAEFLQTDAAVNPGNSGGPMFNMSGEVIGIVSYIITQSGGFEGLGFAVSSNMASRLLLEGPSFWSGVDAFLLSGELARYMNVPGGAGLLVQRVARGSLGERLGLLDGTYSATAGAQKLVLGGDIVLAVQGIPVAAEDFQEQVAELRANLRPGAVLTLTVLRGGEQIELSAAWRP